jgi:hypothetical protein
MATKFVVNGVEQELEMRVNGIDISGDFIGNLSHGMDSDAEGRYIASQEDFDFWQKAIAAHEEMNNLIAAYKERFDPDEIDEIVSDYSDTDIDNIPAEVRRGLEKVLGKIY